MKILRIIYDWPPPWSGLAPHPYELTVAQNHNGHEIDIICGRWPRAGEIAKPLGVNFYPVYRAPFQGTVFFTSCVVAFIKYLRYRRKHTPDIIHAHGHFGFWLYLYRHILRKYFPWSKELKVPLVGHFHNIAKARKISLQQMGVVLNPLSQFLEYPLMEYSDRLLLETSAANVFAGKENKDDAIEYYNIPEEKCFVVESGVNIELFKPVNQEEKEKSRRDLGLDAYDVIILNHGSMVERKNIHVLVQALALLPSSYKLMLAGPGDPTYIEKLHELIKTLGLKDRVILVGYAPYPEVPIAYQVSDIFVLPSSFEGTPKVVMQGLACNIPCLVSGFKLTEDIHGLYYLDQIEPRTIATKIQTLIQSHDTVDVEKIKLYYSWENRAKVIDKAYDYALTHYL